MIKILQCSVYIYIVAQTMLGGLTDGSCKVPIVYCTPAKNYVSWLTVDKVIAICTRLTFVEIVGPPCMCQSSKAKLQSWAGTLTTVCITEGVVSEMRKSRCLLHSPIEARDLRRPALKT